MFKNENVRQDLYTTVNGEWEKTAVIPNDKVSTGGFMDLRDGVEEILLVDAKKISTGEIPAQNELFKEFASYYNKAHDFEARDTAGGSELKTYLDKIADLSNVEDLQEFAVEWSLKGFPLPITTGTSSDMNNTELHALYLGVPRLFLPDKTYYEADNERGKELLEAFAETMRATLPLFDYTTEEAAEIVAKAVAFDAKIVPLVRSAEENADRSKLNNPRRIDEIEAYLDNFSFNQLFTDLIGPDVDTAIVQEPNYYENLSTILRDEYLEELKAWLVVKLTYDNRGILSEEIRQTAGKYEMELQGKPELFDREKDAFYLVKAQYGHVLGNYYGETYFGAEARADVQGMINTMLDVYRERLDANTWLSKATAEKAIEKVNSLTVFIAYPDYYPSEYDHMRVDENLSFFENTIQLNEVKNKLNYDHWNKETDRTRWGMSADTVNAYFSPMNNIICFPSGILQEPFYSLEQGHSKNFGGIGAVIAHEISHGFDNNGARFDVNGNMNNWWTDEDYAAFEEKTKLVIDQYDVLETPAGAVNGKLTVSENIADLGGLTCALESLKREEGYDLREFFLNWAKVWRRKSRPEYENLLLKTDVHAPSYWRANMVPQNFEEFHTTFETQPGDKMYLAPEDRIQIW